MVRQQQLVETLRQVGLGMQQELVLGRAQIAAHAGLVGAKFAKRGQDRRKTA